MKSIYRVLVAGILAIWSLSSSAQAIISKKSAGESAMSDTRFIAASIADNRNAMMLSQKAVDHAANGRVKELAQQMTGDHTTMLYTMQELASAGGSASEQSAGIPDNKYRQAADLNSRLSGLSGADFDTLWVSGVFALQQARYDELVQAKKTVTNPQLKMAITEAVPVIRKHCNQLRVLQKELARMAIEKKKQAAMHQVR
jgi:predicted outer membrane protein